MAWNRMEVEATVADYFHMLILELSGQNYNKTAHRKSLLAKLDDRSDGAVERKPQNISAILNESGCPYIPGYKPLGNYQSLLREVVEQRLAQDQLFDSAALTAASTPAVVPLVEDFSALLVEAPKTVLSTRAPRQNEYKIPSPQKRDYLEREARNASLGTAGEEFVMNFEHFRLRSLGQKALAD